MLGTSARIGELLAIRRGDLDLTTTPGDDIRRNEHVNPLTAAPLDAAFAREDGGASNDGAIDHSYNREISSIYA